jgi:hypothetical protein
METRGMYPSLLLSAALVTPAAPIPRDTDPNVNGPAPRVLAVKADSSGTIRIIGTIPVKVTVTDTYFVAEKNGQQTQKQVDRDVVTSQYVNKTLADFNGKFSTAAGQPLTYDEAVARLKGGATLLASTDGKPVAKAWLRAVDSDTVVMVAEGLSHLQPQFSPPNPYNTGATFLPTTAAPRLVLLAADAAGKVVVECKETVAGGVYPVYYDDGFEGRGGKRSYAYPGGQPAEVKVINKPLADVKFDAYDATGTRLSKTETTKRLAAGGMVLISGDGRVPDPSYLAAFRPDVIVLVGTDLVIPVAPIDQTKKKDPKADQKADPKPEPVQQPLVPPVPPVQKLQPAVIKGRVGVALPVAPPVVEKPVEKPNEK